MPCDEHTFTDVVEIWMGTHGFTNLRRDGCETDAEYLKTFGRFRGDGA